MFKKLQLFQILFFTLFLNGLAQNSYYLNNIKSNFVKDENKQKYYSNLVKNVDNILTNPILISSPSWISALRNAQSISLKNSNVKKGIELALSQKIDKNYKLQQTALELAYTLYKTEFEDLVSKIFNKTKDPISFSISLLYLFRNDNNSNSAGKYLEIIKDQFPNFDKNYILKSLFNDIQNRTHPLQLTPKNISEIFKNDFQKNKTIIYSIHREDRKFPGITIIKKPDGNFLKNNDGTIFHIPQLTLSFSDLPGYLPNGNTPQGIYSLIGWYVSETETIGPTPAVLIRSPFEVNPKIFFHGEIKSKNWNLNDYRSLLPNSWLDHSPIFESYNAGQIGRRLIIIHGSTDEISYFENEPYFPLTPTRGCLSSKEIWDNKTGKLIDSDQLKLIKALKSIDQWQGFLVVFEINNQQNPVEIEEILPFIQ